MNEIELRNLRLKTFTEQNALDYCQLNNINLNNIILLDLGENELTDISGIKLFKNLEKLNLYFNQLTNISGIKLFKNLKDLDLGYNKIKDISVIQYLNNLEYLSISNLELESDQIQYIKGLKNLRNLWCYKGFKDKSVLYKLNKNIRIIK